jgi:concanavalin A-like lectin/glucanase superfamily protein/pectate lyase-like protein
MNMKILLIKVLSWYLLLSASLVLGTTISVDDYGAVGDGATDDTANIQSALDVLKTNGGILTFTSGKTYIISSGLELLYYPADKNYLIQSSDKVKARIKIKDGTENIWGKWGMRLYDSKNITISNICIDGNRQTRNPQDETSGTSIIHIYKNCNGTRLNDLLLINSVMDAIYITAVESDSSTFTTDFEMRNCILSNSYRNNMSIIRGQNFKIIGCEFNNANGHDPEAGIDLEPNPGGADLGYANILIDSCKFYNNNDFGIQLAYAATICGTTTIKDSIFDDNGGGINIGSKANTIKDNIFKNFDHINYRDGIVYFHSNLESDDNQLFNNYFYNNNLSSALHLIWVQYNAGEHNSVYDNYFYNYTCGDIGDASANKGTVQYIYDNSDLIDDSMGYWKMDSASSITDSSDFGQNGMPYNIPVLVPGIVNSAVDFSTDNKYVKIYSNSTLDIKKNMTVSAWIKWNGDNAESYQIITSKQDDWRFGLISIDNNLAKLGFYATGYYSAGWTETSRRIITAGVWHKVAMTYDGVSTKLYLDGVKVASKMGSGDMNSAVSNIYIGAFGYTTYSFNGAIDDVKIRHNTLTEQEIYNEYAKEKCYSWTFDLNAISGITAYGSLESDGINGTAYGSPSFACSQVKQALDFSPDNKYIKISKSSMNLTSSISISAWIKWNGENSDVYQIVVGGADDWRFGLMSFDNDSAKFGFYASGAYSAGWLQTASRVISKGVWHNIAMTYDGSITKLYLNGVEVASEAASGQLSENSAYLYIGSYSGNTYSFNGIIDDVMIYEHALSLDDIKIYYSITE